MKTTLLKYFSFLPVLLMVLTFPLQAQQNINDTPFIEQGSVLGGFQFGLTKMDYNQDIYNLPSRSNQFIVAGIQLDALYFVTDHIGIGPLLNYQSLYPNSYFTDKPHVNEWTLKYGLQAGGYLPFQTVFGGYSRSQLFLKGGVSWLKQHKNAFRPYGWGYQISTGALLAVGKHLGVELALNYLARSEDFVNRTVPSMNFPAGQFPNDTYSSPNSIWHKHLTLSMGFKMAF